MIFWALLFFAIVLLAILLAGAAALGAWWAWKRAHWGMAALLTPIPLVLAAVFTAWILGSLEAESHASLQGEGVDESEYVWRFGSQARAILLWLYLLPALLLWVVGRARSSRERPERG